MKYSYSTAIAPAALGLLMGAVITSVGATSSELSRAYVALPEFELWRVVMVSQIAIYLSITAYLLAAGRSDEMPIVRPLELGTVLLLTVGAISLPTLISRIEAFPMDGQRIRMAMITLFGMVALLVVMVRVVQVYAGFREASDVSAQVRLSEASRNLLMLAAMVVTLATLGAGSLQVSMSALAETTYGFEAHLTPTEVIAYGGYYSLVLMLWFAPVLIAERRAAVRIAHALAPDASADTAVRLGLNVSLADRMKSAFGILAPLIGALATRLLA